MLAPLTLVVAMAENRVIGRDVGLPWHIPADLKRFKQVTMGHPMVMGRTTFESIGRVLPGRPHIVVTRDPDFRHDGVEVAHSIDGALELAAAHGTGEIMVIGGAQIYRQTLGRANVLDICEVKAEVAGDTYVPAFDRTVWRESSRVSHRGEGDYDFDFLRYER